MRTPKKFHGRNIEQLGPRLWSLDVRVVMRGKEYRKREHFEGTKDEATARYLALKTAIREQSTCSLKLPIQSIKTFKDILALYRKELELDNRLSRSQAAVIAYVERELGDRTLRDFAESLERYLEVKEAAVREFQRKKYLRENPEVTPEALAKLPYRPHVRNRFIQVCRAAFNEAIRKKLFTVNPITADRFPKRRELARKDVRFDSFMGKRLLDAVKVHAPYLEPFVRFSLMVPSRKMELVRAQKKDLDLENGLLIVPVENSKNGEVIRKPIPPSFMEYFKNLPGLNEYADGQQYLFHRRTDEGFYVTLGDFKRAWKGCLKVAGIKGLRVHDLRHIAATGMARRGVPARVIMSIAGWKTDMLGTYYGEHIGDLRGVNLYGDAGHGHQMDTQLSMAG